MTRGALAEPNGAIEKGSSLIPSEEYLKAGGAGFNTASQQRNAAYCVLMRTWILYPAGGQMGDLGLFPLEYQGGLFPRELSSSLVFKQLNIDPQYSFKSLTRFFISLPAQR